MAAVKNPHQAGTTTPGIEGLWENMFMRYQKDDTNNIRAMVRYTLRNKGTADEIERFIENHEEVLFRKVGEYLLKESRKWPMNDEASAKQNRSRVRNEIVGMWE